MWMYTQDTSWSFQRNLPKDLFLFYINYIFLIIFISSLQLLTARKANSLPTHLKKGHKNHKYKNTAFSVKLGISRQQNPRDWRWTEDIFHKLCKEKWGHTSTKKQGFPSTAILSLTPSQIQTKIPFHGLILIVVLNLIECNCLIVQINPPCWRKCRFPGAQDTNHLLFLLFLFRALSKIWERMLGCVNVGSNSLHFLCAN